MDVRGLPAGMGVVGVVADRRRGESAGGVAGGLSGVLGEVARDRSIDDLSVDALPNGLDVQLGAPFDQPAVEVVRVRRGPEPGRLDGFGDRVGEQGVVRSEAGRYELKGSAFTRPFFRATPSTFNDADMSDDDTGFRCATPAETMEALISLRT